MNDIRELAQLHRPSSDLDRSEIARLTREMADFKAEMLRMVSVLVEDGRAAKERLAVMDGQMTWVKQQMQRLLPVTQLPLARALPEYERFSKVHCDLFHNTGSGTAEWLLKVFVTLDGDKNKNGSIRPIYYWLHRADEQNCPDGWELHQAVDSLLATGQPNAMVGCMSWKAKKDDNGGGSGRNKDEVAIWRDDRLTFFSPHGKFEMPPGKKVESNKPDSPIMRWTWYRNAPAKSRGVKSRSNNSSVSADRQIVA